MIRFSKNRPGPRGDLDERAASLPGDGRSGPNGGVPDPTRPHEPDAEAPDPFATGHPLEGQLEVLRGWFTPELGPLDDQHAVGAGQLVVLEPERFERSVADRSVFAETKQVEVHQLDRAWVDHADRVGRTAHPLGSRDVEPSRERSHQRGLAGSHLAAQQHDVAAAQAGAERKSPPAHLWLIELERGDVHLADCSGIARRRTRVVGRADMLRRSSRLALGLGFALALAPGCDADEPPSFAAVDEPKQALRPADLRGQVPEDAHVVDYWIDARLDERAHEIHGTLRMAWRNSTTRTVDALPFHLYMNAFRAEDTAWMADARGEHRGQEFERDRWGFVDVTRVERVAHDPGQDALALEHVPSEGQRTALRFAEDADPTTMSVSLDAPLGPGASIVLELAFTTRLPQVFARTGYHDEFHMAGQWFPKIGVLEQDGGWQAHTFSLFSEFYADFGDYEVFLDVPEHYVVGATGIAVAEHDADAGRKRLHYRAQMVHDFAWVADPNFIEHWGEYEGIRIRQLIQPDHVDDAQAHLDVQIAALASMQSRFGPYPWSTITIVHAPAGAEGAGGMEYPTLYTTSDIELPEWMPAWLLNERVSGLFTSVHEFGHQYFQGMFASNEHAQPWLDEGINTMSNQLVYWDAYGEDPWLVQLLGHELTTKDLMLLALLGAGDRDRVDQPADGFDPLADSYGTVTYQKTAAVMLTLRELCGREPWDRAFARYSEAARFRHPTGAQLERILVEEIGGADGRLALVGDGGPGTVWLDVQQYLDHGLRDAAVADFELQEVGNQPMLGHAGWHRAAPGEPLPAEPSQAIAAAEQIVADVLDRPSKIGPSGWTLTPAPTGWPHSVASLADDEVEGFVLVARRSSFRVPVEVLVEFADGETTTVIWDGQADHHRFDFPGRRVERAIVDPRLLLLIEPRKLDNARWAEGKKSKPEEPLSSWIGDVGEAANLAVLGGMGI